MPRHFALVSAVLSLSAIFAAALYAQASHRTVLLPRLNVWAWERDEDLSYIDPSKISVAYFAGNIYVHGSNVRFRPRTQKLKLPDSTQTIPVFRIESIRSDGSMPELSAASFVAKTISKTLTRSPKQEKTVQIDFDALADERPFYKALLRELRKEIPPNTKISVTALASWLLADKWLERGSADETVAMLFSIGPERNDVLSRLSKQSLSNGADIPLSIGISASEGDTNKILLQSNVFRNNRILYVFSSLPWTEQRLRTITGAITKEAPVR